MTTNKGIPVMAASGSLEVGRLSAYSAYVLRSSHNKVLEGAAGTVDTDEWFKAILAEVKETQRSVSVIQSTLAAQHVTLEEHQRRSLANEKAVEQVRAEIKPISVHVAVVGAIGKVLATVGTLVGIAAGLARLLGHG
jgi:hypothetical protein